MREDPSRHVVFLTGDLIFSSRAEAIAQRTNVTIHAVAGDERAVAACGEFSVEILIVDLTAPGIDVARLIPRIRAIPHSPRIVCYAPHIRADLLSAAMAAGCDLVLTRGQFDARLGDILSGA